MTRSAKAKLPKTNTQLTSPKRSTTRGKIYDINHIIIRALGITSFFVTAYCLLSFNSNISYFVYYHSLTLWISSAIFILCGTFSNIIMKIESMPSYQPHPFFWRCLISIQIWYCLFLMVLIFQPNLTDIRHLFKIFDDSLNTPIATRSYATDCWNFSSAVIIDKLDRFILAHSALWLCGGLVVRHRGILWFTSILWEVIEIITCYFIPNFGECWWDQLILDIFICNGIGLELGLFIASKLKCDPPIYEYSYLYSWKNIKFKTFKFFGFNISDSQRCLFGKKKYIRPIKKVYFEDFEWIIEYFWALFGPCYQLSISITMNAFLLKLWLWVPTEHWLNAFRLALLVFLCLGCKEQYYYGSILRNRGIKTKTWSGKIHKFGDVCYLWLFMNALECIVIYRACPDMNTFPVMPMYNKIWLYSVISMFAIYSFILFRAY